MCGGNEIPGGKINPDSDSIICFFVYRKKVKYITLCESQTLK